MGLVLELSPELERELAARAAQLQLPLAEYALRVLAGSSVVAPRFSSGGELLAYWKDEGLVGTKSSIADASEHARALRREAEKRLR